MNGFGKRADKDHDEKSIEEKIEKTNSNRCCLGYWNCQIRRSRDSARSIGVICYLERKEQSIWHCVSFGAFIIIYKNSVSICYGETCILKQKNPLRHEAKGGFRKKERMTI